jgi:hypothetical protein
MTEYTVILLIGIGLMMVIVGKAFTAYGQHSKSGCPIVGSNWEQDVRDCPETCRLMFGPYTPPRVRKGDRAYCEFRAAQVIVTSWSDARLLWPRCQKPKQRGGSGLLVTDELKRAVESESSAALVYWFGVSQATIWKWRQAFGVSMWGTPGSKRLHNLVSQSGANAMKARNWTEAERRQRRRTAKRLNVGRFIMPCKRPNGSRLWTRREMQLFERLPDREIAIRTGRTVGAVRQKREKVWAAAME